MPPRRCRWARLPGVLLVVAIVCGRRVDAQPVASDATNTWAVAVEAYLAGEDERATPVLRLTQAEIATQARTAHEAWGAGTDLSDDVGADTSGSVGTPAPARDRRRLAVRRIQGSAALALEILLRVSARIRVVSVSSGFEDAAVDAWQRLGKVDDAHLPALDDRRQLARFRQWWQVGYLQYLLNTQRIDFEMHAERLRLAGADPALQAEYHVLQGMRAESRSRLTVMSSATSRSQTLRNDYTPSGQDPAARMRTLRRGLEDAGRAYARALEAVPEHEEATLRAGRVALERGQPAQAIARLAPLVRMPCASVTCGLAALFTGEAHDRMAQLEEASRAYAVASSVHQVRQSALVALMQAAIRRGDPDGGRSLTTHFETHSPLGQAEGPDAWSVYLSGQRTDVAAVVVPLRGAVLP